MWNVILQLEYIYAATYNIQGTSQNGLRFVSYRPVVTGILVTILFIASVFIRTGLYP